MTIADETVTPAAWYPCPVDSERLRWWDGERWTNHTMDPSQIPETDEIVGAPSDEQDLDDLDVAAFDAPHAGYLGRPWSGPRRSMGLVPKAPSPATLFWVWLMPVAPAIQIGLFVLLLARSPSWAFAVSFAAAALFYLIAALGDAEVLRQKGHRPVGWGWAVLQPAYFVLRLVRIGRGAIVPLIAWAVAQGLAIAAIVLIVSPMSVEMTSVALYDGEPAAGASTTRLSAEERAELLTPEGMSAKILDDMRAEGSIVNDVTCPAFGRLRDAEHVTCRIEMVHSSADVDVQVTDRFPNAAFVVVRFTYDE